MQTTWSPTIFDICSVHNCSTFYEPIKLINGWVFFDKPDLLVVGRDAREPVTFEGAVIIDNWWSLTGIVVTHAFGKECEEYQQKCIFVAVKPIRGPKLQRNKIIVFMHVLLFSLTCWICDLQLIFGMTQKIFISYYRTTEQSNVSLIYVCVLKEVVGPSIAPSHPFPFPAVTIEHSPHTQYRECNIICCVPPHLKTRVATIQYVDALIYLYVYSDILFNTWWSLNIGACCFSRKINDIFSLEKQPQVHKN